MAAVVAFSSFTAAEIARAATWARGLRALHPEWSICGVLVDAPPTGLEGDWRKAFDRLLDPAELYGDGWRAFAFMHDAPEAPAAVRGRALRRLFSDGADAAFYFAPDICVFDDLSEVARRLEAASILLTPHQAEPNEGAQAIADNEATSMRHGVYHLGFLGVRNDPAGRALARWWASRLDGACYDESGRFNDQSHFDLAPALFDRVEVLRDPGCHVGSWNLSRRRVEIARDGRILVNETHPLKFYNFVDAYGDGAILTERYAGRRLGPHELSAYYKRALIAAGASSFVGLPWAYGRYDDGSAIDAAARRLYREDPDLPARFPDPFATGPDSYRAWLETSRPDLL